jgi:hypothetical protein
MAWSLRPFFFDCGHFFSDRLAARIEVGELVWVFSTL